MWIVQQLNCLSWQWQMLARAENNGNVVDARRYTANANVIIGRINRIIRGEA